MGSIASQTRNAVQVGVVLGVIATAEFLGTGFPFRARFNESRTHGSKMADTLFHPGIVKWLGKEVGPGAVAAWKQSSETNSARPEKDAVGLRMLRGPQR